MAPMIIGCKYENYRFDTNPIQNGDSQAPSAFFGLAKDFGSADEVPAGV